jgi:hypothetical protein
MAQPGAIPNKWKLVAVVMSDEIGRGVGQINAEQNLQRWWNFDSTTTLKGWSAAPG